MHFGDFDALNAGVGELEADELGELFAHGFFDAFGAEGVHDFRIASREPLDDGIDEGAAEEPSGLAFGLFEYLGGALAGTGDGDDGDEGVLPDVLEVDFGDGDVVGAAEAVLEAEDVVAFFLEGVAVFEAKFEGEDADGGHD